MTCKVNQSGVTTIQTQKNVMLLQDYLQETGNLQNMTLDFKYSRQ